MKKFIALVALSITVFFISLSIISCSDKNKKFEETKIVKDSTKIDSSHQDIESEEEDGNTFARDLLLVD